MNHETVQTLVECSRMLKNMKKIIAMTCDSSAGAEFFQDGGKIDKDLWDEMAAKQVKRLLLEYDKLLADFEAM